MLWNAVFDPEMWVKKECVGLLPIADMDSLIDVEVRIKAETIEAVHSNHDGAFTLPLDETTVGRIMMEDDTQYYVTFPGAWGFDVDKEDVIFIGQ